MSIHCRSCHGQFDCLQTCSTPHLMKRVFKVYQKVRSYAVWYLENMGVWGTLSYALIGMGKPCATRRGRQHTLSENERLSPDQEILGLRVGELVQVKSIDEIMATLGNDRKYKGLLWMTGMRKFCGKKYRVFKSVDKILLESNGELRNMKNTVILEGVMCDGSEFCGCDRSCFHFWREIWLRRVPEEQS